MRMGREPDRHRVAVFDQLIRKRSQLVAVYSRVDQQHTGMSPHDHRIGLHEVALVHQYVLGDLRQHDRSPSLTKRPVSLDSAWFRSWGTQLAGIVTPQKLQLVVPES